MNQKKKTWKACSNFIRLRDSIEYCKGLNMPIYSGVAKCCTCENVREWKRMDAGHFIGRGIGGGSGVYFDERNINIQCKRCNGFLQGNPEPYKVFMRNKYGQETIDQLRWLHKNHSYKGQLVGLELYYIQKFDELKGR